MLVSLDRVRASGWLVMLLGLLFSGCSSPPDDEVLIERFTQNRVAFDRLLLISRAQWERYHTIDIRNDGDTEAHQIMKRLAIRWVTGGDCYVKFSCGLDPGDNKGYAYFESASCERHPRPVDVFASLDTSPQQVLRYRSLGDGWYLFHWYYIDPN